MAGLTTCIGALLVYVVTTTPTITARHGGADGGELVATALSGGVAHPPGYPTYLLLARTALVLPWGEPAARLALLSALAAAAAVGCTAALVTAVLGRSTTRASGTYRALAGLYAGTLFAVSPRLWSQAIIVEVYALHMLWLVLFALLSLLWLHTQRDTILLVAALCLGIGLGTHLTLLMVVPAAVAAWVVTPNRPKITLVRFSGMIVVLLLGLSVYALLPLWAMRETIPSWGDQRSFTDFWAHVSSAEYRYLIGRVPLDQQLQRLGFAARDLLAQPGLIGLGLAVWGGLTYGWRVQRPLLAFTVVVALCGLVFAISYGGADGDVYLLPWTWTWCVWAGLGLFAVVQSMHSAFRWWWIAVAALVVSPVWSLATHYAQLNLRGDTSERDRITQHLQALPSGALLFTSDDADTFGAWYVQRALDVRPDVIVIDTRLIERGWYREQIQRRLNHDLCVVLDTEQRPVYVWQGDAVAPLNDQQWRMWVSCE
jgi:hypothetical protein